MRVAFAADHGGAALKAELLRRLADDGHELVDLGGDGSDPRPTTTDGSPPPGPRRPRRRGRPGILVAARGSAPPSPPTSPRHPRHRPRTLLAHQGVEHDDMNILCLGGRVIGREPALSAPAPSSPRASPARTPRPPRRPVLAIEARSGRAGGPPSRLVRTPSQARPKR